jgi:hypothetical protein
MIIRNIPLGYGMTELYGILKATIEEVSRHKEEAEK